MTITLRPISWRCSISGSAAHCRKVTTSRAILIDAGVFRAVLIAYRAVAQRRGHGNPVALDIGIVIFVGNRRLARGRIAKAGEEGIDVVRPVLARLSMMRL